MDRCGQVAEGDAGPDLPAGQLWDERDAEAGGNERELDREVRRFGNRSNREPGRTAGTPARRPVWSALWNGWRELVPMLHDQKYDLTSVGEGRRAVESGTATGKVLVNVAGRPPGR